MALDIKKALDIRKRVKSKKPTFIRQDAHKKSKLKACWRKPRGLHSKMRMKKRSYRRLPAIGYGSPRVAKDLNRFGLKEIIVSNVADLLKIKESTKNLSGYSAVIAAGVGTRKKVSIVKKAIELGFVIDNVKNPDNYETSVKQLVEGRQKASKSKSSSKEKKVSEADAKNSKKKDSKSIDNTVADEKEDKPKVVKTTTKTQSSKATGAQKPKVSGEATPKEAASKEE